MTRNPTVVVRQPSLGWCRIFNGPSEFSAGFFGRRPISPAQVLCLWSLEGNRGTSTLSVENDRRYYGHESASHDSGWLLVDLCPARS